jgi:ribose 5-phosphate isomerase B
MVGADMRLVALGADHAGFPLKEDLKAWLIAQGHQVVDFGTDSAEAVDYPDFAARVAEAVRAGAAECGVLVCGTGIGMAIAANKVAGVRAAPCSDTDAARLSRAHNDANILTLGARVVEKPAAMAVLETWLATDFAGGRHARRVAKLVALERAGVPLESPHAAAR